MGGGGGSTAEKYAKFGAGEYSSSDFESYVDSRPDLAAAWRKIESDPSAPDSRYWIDKGASSKSAFGRAHAAEDAELYSGTYGDAGDTKVLPGTPEYEAYFGDSGGTSFDSFISSPSSSGESSGGGGGSMSRPSSASSPVPSNPYYPQLVQEYEAPGLMDYSSYMPADSIFGYEQYQPWTNPNNINDSIFNYQPPTIYAGLSRAPDGSLTRYSGGPSSGTSLGDGRYMSGGPSIGGGSESGSESSSSADSGSGIFDSEGKYQASKDVIPGTSGITVQDLFDYESKGTETPIYNDKGVQDRRYFVPPDMRQEIVQQDIQRAKEEAYIKAAKPVVIPLNNSRVTPLAPADVIEWTRTNNGSEWVRDQLKNEVERVTNLIDFRPTSREEAQYGSASRKESPDMRGYDGGMGAQGSVGGGYRSGGDDAYGGGRGNPRGGGT